MKSKRNLIRILLLCAMLLAGFAAEAQPVITQQPTNQVVVVGGLVTLNVSVSGSGPFSYRWLRYGTNLPYIPTITTVAGNGTNGYSGDSHAATNAELNYPIGLAVDNIGNLLIADTQNQRIRKVGTNGIISTVAGDGAAAYYPGDGVAAIYASFNNPSGAAVDNAGNLFIADYNNSRVRKVGANGIITTVAGNGTTGYSGDGSAATSAELYHPFGVTVDSAGNLFIADYNNSRVRKVGANGIITTLAGNGTNGYSGDGNVATNAELYYPSGVAVDSMGNLFIADLSNQRIRKVGTNGIITTVAGNGTSGWLGDGSAATNAKLYNPYGVAVDSACNLLITDQINQRIRKVWMYSAIPSLTLTNISDPNSGNYQVIIYGNGGSVTSSVATLTDVPLVITRQPQSQTVMQFSNTTFSVAATAQTSLWYQWYFDNSPLSGQTNAALALLTVTNSNAGSYFVLVTNIYGSVTSAVATLTVVLPPKSFKGIFTNSHQLRLQFTGTTNYPYILQSATNLMLPVNWQPVLTNPADSNGNWQFTDTNLNERQKFYRAVGQ